MQNRIENPFGAQRGGRTQSKFHASSSARNQPRIAPESKAESLTVTAPNTGAIAAYIGKVESIDRGSSFPAPLSGNIDVEGINRHGSE